MKTINNHPEKICLNSLGCPKNLVDSEVNWEIVTTTVKKEYAYNKL